MLSWNGEHSNTTSFRVKQRVQDLKVSGQMKFKVCVHGTSSQILFHKGHHVSSPPSLKWDIYILIINITTITIIIQYFISSTVSLSATRDEKEVKNMFETCSHRQPKLFMLVILTNFVREHNSFHIPFRILGVSKPCQKAFSIFCMDPETWRCQINLFLWSMVNTL